MRWILNLLRRHPLSAGVGAVVLAVGVWLGWDLGRVALAPDTPASIGLPEAPRLTAGPGETVYRIDASRSVATVGVREELAGARTTAELTTRSMAGDLAVNGADVGRSRIGEVVVNVEQLESDNRLRDKAIRSEFLESTRFPYVRLTDATISGPVGPLEEGRRYEVVIEGTLEVHGEQVPSRWEGEVAVSDGELTATVESTLLMSEVGIGPIRKAGLVRTEDEVSIRLDLVAVDEARFELRAAARAERAAGGEGDGPSFAREVAPVLAANCASCHQPGHPGAHAWTLATAGDAAEVAEGLALVTGSGYMPPWPASPRSLPFDHDRSLSEADIDVIRRWATAGGPLDVPDDSEVRPPADGTPRPPADLVLTASEPYQGSPAKRDDYRCFILDPELDEPASVVSFTFVPDQVSIVHHALVYRYRAEERAAAEQLDAGDPGPGFECVAVMAGVGGGEQLMTWTPGQDPTTFPEGLGFDLQPGDVLLTQIHYHYAHPAPPDLSRLELDLAEDPDAVEPLVHRALIAPVELPCPPGVTAPLCDRAAARADAAARFGPIGGIIPDALHGTCGTTPESLAARSDGITATTACEVIIPYPVEVIDVLGHMHEIGSRYRMTLSPGTPGERVVLDIPVWDFNWQLNYRLSEPLVLGAGDRLLVECSWDRRLRHDPEPRYVLFAEGTQDEMCFSSLTYRELDGVGP